MSSALGLAAVSAVLENLLGNVYTSSGLGSVKVSALAPDIVQNAIGNGAEASPQVNLFLHQVTPNTAWRNACLPSLDTGGATRLQNPPLALDLHYLLTAYASQDCQAEALLGFAVQMLHENPVLTRQQIQTLVTLPTNPALSALLALSGLASQFEMIKITPATLGREEVAWLWTALKADYRPTFPFQVSVVLIQAERPLLSSLPVLQRTVTAQPDLLSPFATLSEIMPPNAQPAAGPGDVVTVTGSRLTGVASVVLVNSRLGIRQTLAPLAGGSDFSFQFTIPSGVPELPAGLYLASAQVTAGSDVTQSNGLPLAVAPRIDAAWAPGTLGSGPAVSVTIPCAPHVQPGQQVSLLIGGQEAPAQPFTSATNTPSFTFRPLAPTGQVVPVRLRVDGIDSPIVDRTKSPPVFTGPSVQVI